jgi:hypothetical protein
LRLSKTDHGSYTARRLTWVASADHPCLVSHP